MKKIILVVGCGKTGASVCEYFYNKHETVALFDDNSEKSENLRQKFRGVETVTLDNLENIIDKIDFAVLSPGIRTRYNPHKIIEILKENNIKTVSDYDIFFQNLPDKTKVIGITGTNGKSTVTALLDFTLNKLGKNSIACGNIGIPVLSCDTSGMDYIVLECSSYQLEISNISFYSGLFLNLTPDHLDYHGGIREYLEQKQKVFSQNKFSVCSADKDYALDFKFPDNCSLISTQKILPNGFSYHDGCFYLNGKQLSFNDKKPKIIGLHNIKNILFVLQFCQFEGFSPEQTWSAICEFEPLPHRMQFVRKLENITFINDSKATNPDSTKQALKSIDDVYLILGGISKYEESIDEIKEFFPKIKAFFLIGSSKQKFFDDLPEKCTKFLCQNLMDATKIAFETAKNDLKKSEKNQAVILLSPMCASFDEYKNFEERGFQFIDIVNNLV